MMFQLVNPAFDGDVQSLHVFEAFLMLEFLISTRVQTIYVEDENHQVGTAKAHFTS